MPGAATPASPANEAPLRPPVAAPRASITGCIESAELKRHVLALDAHRRQAREAALVGLGARRVSRTVSLGAVGDLLALDSELESGGRRQVVVGHVAAASAPPAALAQVGGVSYRIAERPRAHATPLLVCGVRRCGPASDAQHVQAPVRALLVELGSGERWGGALALEYDYWWADVRYDRAETCPAGAAPQPSPPQPSPSQPSPSQPRASSAARETP